MYNAMNVPYGSLAYVLTRAAEERDLLSIVRMIMASAARLVTVCGTLPLVKVWGDGQDAWVKAAAIWAGACFQSMQTVLFVVMGTSLTYYCKYVFGNDSWMCSLRARWI